MRLSKKKARTVILACVVVLLVSCKSCFIGKRCNGLECPITPDGTTEQIISHIGYTVSYNQDYLIPNWVAYELTAGEADGELPRKDDFRPDPSVIGRSAVTGDYTKSGYDRGHMAPAADMKWSEQAMSESFFLSNICPQDHSLNAGAWNTIEEAQRRWARQSGAVYVACGPIVKRNHATIGKNGVAVPDAFYKVVLRQHEGQWAAIGFVFPNEPPKLKPYDYACTVDEVEELTGIDFFHNLPDVVERVVESTLVVKEWNR